jgi:hypothetical protein
VARLVVMNEDMKNVCYEEIQLCAQNVLLIIGSIVARAYYELILTYFEILFYLHLNFNFETFGTNLCDLQLL